MGKGTRKATSMQGSAADTANMCNPALITGHAPVVPLPPTGRDPRKRLAASYPRQAKRLTGARMGTPGVRKYGLRWPGSW